MKCPNCNETLAMADRQGVEIDYCPSCRGIWLDKGELDKIIERSSQYESDSQQQDNDYRRDDDDDDRYKQRPPQQQKKRRGFLGDFFDFD